MAEATRGMLDTSVVFDHDQIDPERLPDESAIEGLLAPQGLGRRRAPACPGIHRWHEALPPARYRIAGRRGTPGSMSATETPIQEWGSDKS